MLYLMKFFIFIFFTKNASGNYENVQFQFFVDISKNIAENIKINNVYAKL